MLCWKTISHVLVWTDFELKQPFHGNPFPYNSFFFYIFFIFWITTKIEQTQVLHDSFFQGFFPKKIGWKRRGTVLSPWIPDLIPFLWKIICNGIFQYLNVKLQNVIWGQMSNSILSPFYAIFIEVEIWWTRFHDLYKPSISLLAKMIQRKIWSTDFQIENDWDGLNPH